MKKKDNINYKLAFKVILWAFIIISVLSISLILLVSKYVDYKENGEKYVDKDCFKGCEYGFTRGELNIIAIDGFTRENCKRYCAVN